MIYLEEEIARHRKFVLAGSMIPKRGGMLAALGLYVAGLGYAREHLTNGFVDDAFLDTFPTETCAKDVAKVLANRRVRLWHRERDGYRIHDFEQHNESADKVRHRRELARERKRRQRKRDGVGQQGVLPDVTHTVTRDVQRDPARTRGTTTPLPTTASCTNQLGTSVLPSCTDRGEKNAPAALTSPRVLAFRRFMSKQTDSGKPAFGVIRALARAVMEEHSDVEDDGEVEDLVMRRCARDANLLYDSGTVKRAVEQARAQLRRRQA